MGIETARQLRDQVREGLAELIRLVNDPSTPAPDRADLSARPLADAHQPEPLFTPRLAGV